MGYGPVLRSLCFSLLIAVPFLLEAQTLPPRVTSYPPSAYSGHNQVLAVDILPDGRPVFGTGQVFFHHGEGFDNIPLPEGKLSFSLSCGPSGRLLVGGQELMGLVLPDSGGTSTYRSFLPLLPDSIEDLGIVWGTCWGTQGAFYFQTLERLFYGSADSIRVLEPKNRFNNLSAPYGVPLVQDLGHGLYRLKGGERELLPLSPDSLHKRGINAMVQAYGKEGKKLAVFTKMDGGYLYDLSSGDSKPLTSRKDGLEDPLKGERVWEAVSLNPEKNPYGAAYAVGTKTEGLHLLSPEGRSLLRIGKSDGLPSEMVWEMEVDKRGNIWAATDNGMALLHTGSPFTFANGDRFFEGDVTDIDRLSSQRIPSVEDGPLYLSTGQGAWAWKEEEGDFERLKGTAGRKSDLEPFVEENGRRSMLIGAGPGGLMREGEGSEEMGIPVDTISERFTLAIHRLPFPEEELVIVSGREGLFILAPPEEEGGSWTERFALEDPPGEWVTFGLDRNSSTGDSVRIWCGSRNKGVFGLTIDRGLSGYELEHYDQDEGMPQGEVSVFSGLPGDEVLFGTVKGVLSFEEGRFRPYCEWGERFCDSSRQAFIAKAGLDEGIWLNAWMNDGSGGSVSHLKAHGDHYRVDSTVFRVLDLGSTRSIHPEQDRTWIGGAQGLAAYHPEVRMEEGSDWDCRIRAVKGSADSTIFDGTFWRMADSSDPELPGEAFDRVPVADQPSSMEPTLPFSRNRIEFSFAASYPDRQEAVSYSYRLKGFDTAWSKWTQEDLKEYTNLPEGKYIFQVKARNIYGRESHTASYRFRILAPWYRTWIAYGAYSLLSIAFVWAVAWLNGRRLTAKKEALERLVNERTKAIQEEKSKLQLQKEETERQKERVEEAHREIGESIDYAQRIQQTLLRKAEESLPSRQDAFILFKPRDKVSGDLYWFKEQGGSLFVAAIDCTGHGVPGAFMSMLAVSALNEIMVQEESLQPGSILDELQRRVVRELVGKGSDITMQEGMDAAIVKISNANSGSNSKDQDLEGHSAAEGFPPRREVQFAGAQNPLYVLRKGIVEDPPSVISDQDQLIVPEELWRPFKRSEDGVEIKGDRFSVAYDEQGKRSFRTLTVELRKGDLLYIFSDGFPDQFGGPKGKKFGYRSFQELLARVHKKPLSEQKEALNEAFEEWRERSGQEQIDDVLVIGLRL